MKRIILFALIGFASSFAFAVTNTSSNSETSSNTTSTKTSAVMSRGDTLKGVRVEAILPMTTFTFKFRGQKVGSMTPDNALGVGVGYAYLPVRNVGFTGKASYLNLRENNEDAGLARIEGNIGMAVNNFFHFKGGTNISKIVSLSSGDASVFNAGIGLQTSLGLQMSKFIGVELGYAYMAQTITSGGFTADLIAEGPELSLTGTF